MMQSRNFFQFKNCACFLSKQINHQNSLVRTIVQLNNEAINRPTNQLSALIENTQNLNQFQELTNFSKFTNQQPNLSKKLNLPSSLNTDYNPFEDKPTREQIEELYHYLESMFPKFFTERIDLSRFEEHVHIIDNQSGVPKEEKGFERLIQKISFIRIYYSIMYSMNIMNVLNIAKIPEEGLVKLRWRIVSKGRLFIFLKIWKVRELKRKEYWNDGIVYFYLNKHGKIKKVVIEKVEKDKNEDLSALPLDPFKKIAKV